MRILGIDPGSRKTGFGIIDLQHRKTVYITSGHIKTQSSLMPLRLGEIFTGLTEVIEQFQPTMAAIEQVFMYRNAASALKLGQARGVAILACVQYNLTIHEYAPTKIKQTVVGKGHASKIQVQQMVKVLLALPSTPQEDAADALAVALCHARYE
ncbi:MAG: crossover junction endodeoxyribonuclease RuvC [Thiomargarita sp.]|nr:crossover junction endodeoxyribonuclease RuvC [Thiomargarita sp.]